MSSFGDVIDSEERGGGFLDDRRISYDIHKKQQKHSSSKEEVG